MVSGDRRAEGFTDPENVAMAKAQQKQKEKELREFIDKTNADEGAGVLKRDSSREKTYERETVYPVEPNYAKQFEPFNADHIPSTATITPEIVEEELNKSEVGREALQYIKDTEIQPKFVYKPQRHSNRGQQWGNSIEIYVDNIQSPLVATQTVIHEITHHKYGIAGFQWAEAVCMAKEKMHKENRTYLTIPEKRYIVKLAKDNYADKDWKKGGTRYGRPSRLR